GGTVSAAQQEHDPPPGGEHEHEDPPGGPVYVPLGGADAGASDAGVDAGVPPVPPVLDPAAIPKFAHELVVPPVLVPTRARSRAGAADGSALLEYALSVRQTRVQMLPPPLPQTTVLDYGGNVQLRGSD